MIENYNVQLLLKFVEPQFTEGTLDGDLFFKNINFFIELEEQQIDKGIGDKREGNWSKPLNPKTHNIFIGFGDEQIQINFQNAVMHETFDDLKDLSVCCFVVLSMKNDDFLVSEVDNKIKLKPEVEQKLSEQFEGRDMLIFPEPAKLLARIDEACQNAKLDHMRGLVTYYDELEPHPLSKEEYKEKPHKTLLYKRNFFEFQKEYRIVIKNPFPNDFTLKIGDLRDIAYNLGNIEKGNIPLEIQYNTVAPEKEE